MAIIEKLAFNNLLMHQSVETNIKVQDVHQHLALDDDVSINLKVEAVESQLYFSHSATAAVEFSRSIAQALSLTHSTLARVFVEVVEQHLALSQDAQVVTDWPDVKQQLSLTQVADYYLAKGTYSFLPITQSVTFTITRNINIEQVLSLVSTAAGHLPSKYWTSYDVVLEEP